MTSGDLFLELASIQDSKSGVEQFLVADNLGVTIGVIIVLLPVFP